MPLGSPQEGPWRGSAHMARERSKGSSESLHRRIATEPVGVVHVLVSGKATEHRLRGWVSIVSVLCRRARTSRVSQICIRIWDTSLTGIQSNHVNLLADLAAGSGHPPEKAAEGVVRQSKSFTGPATLSSRRSQMMGSLLDVIKHGRVLITQTKGLFM
jgi:hypothetical protein